ncbi:MAG: hypothetical protein HN576_07825 [Bacteriovoracaceae bacterium]|nr:hypothetical protein [Bacteriovoracaceae bacterium]
MTNQFGKTLIVGIVFTFSTLSVSFGKEIALAKFFQKTNNDQSILYIITDDKEDAVKFRFDILDKSKNIERSIPITVKQLKKGIVVLVKKGTDVITLKGADIESHNGGYINLNFLKMWKFWSRNKYGNTELLLDRVGDDWELQLNGVPFTELFAHDHSKGIHKFTIKK